MKYVNMAELKQAISVERCAEMLNVTMRKENTSIRAVCPFCKGGDPREFGVIPSRQMFKCYAAETGGDLIDMIAHTRGYPIDDNGRNRAANEIATHFNFTSSTEPRKTSPSTSPPAQPARGMKPLDYLDPFHESLERLGLPDKVADALGAGFAPTGTIKGYIGIPLLELTPDATVLGYLKVSTDPAEVPQFVFPKNLLERLEGKVVQLKRKT